MATTTPTAPAPVGERADLVDSLRRHRGFLLTTVDAITDDQARERTTVSELTLGGLIKHVATTEEQWAEFVASGPADAIDYSTVDWSNPPAEVVAFMESHRMGEDETLAGLLERYAEVAAATDRLVAELPDLDLSWPLPEAPWFEPGARWTARRTFLHIIAETAQHAGHADIIREALDGQKTMG
ncbi:DinB family protein [Nocardioides sp. GY 10113]|uniref:DinB family protein n=1 Tax=Nocardioides sp. GY 10113 TaxID=2569761 RepID=UPI0010A88C76|nr:DinB family protein [Nocardioides sp. GY 10113]TIC88542.1 DinB family protein [Nocardioides sp. GY 10113]